MTEKFDPAQNIERNLQRRDFKVVFDPLRNCDIARPEIGSPSPDSNQFKTPAKTLCLCDEPLPSGGRHPTECSNELVNLELASEGLPQRRCRTGVFRLEANSSWRKAAISPTAPLTTSSDPNYRFPRRKERSQLGWCFRKLGQEHRLVLRCRLLRRVCPDRPS